jgi:transposase
MSTQLGYERRDAKKLEARRFVAVARLKRGESSAAVARSLGVSLQSVQRWARWHRSGGAEGLRRRPKTGGPRPKLPPEKLARLGKLLEEGPLAHGFDTPVWTTERVTHLIWRRFRVRYSRDHVKHTLLPRLHWRWHKHTWLPAEAETGAHTSRMS